MIDHLPVKQIKLGRRHRHDLGDIPALAASIAQVGLLHPLVLDPDHRLIAGQRRLAAVQALGWEQVSVRVVASLADAHVALEAERDENTCRKDFTPLEAVALGKALEKLEMPRAKERQGRPGKARSDKLDQHANGRTRAQVGAAVGMGGTTYEKAKFVATKAEEDPNLYAEIAEEMERTGKVDPAYKKAKRQEAHGQVPLSRIAEIANDRTATDDLKDAIAALRQRLLGVEHKYGSWPQVAKGLDEEDRQDLVVRVLTSMIDYLKRIAKELT